MLEDEYAEEVSAQKDWEPDGSPRANEVKVYLNYIRKTPTLTPEQECALAEKMRLGRRAAIRLKELEQGGSSADPREAEECAADIRAGDRAKRQLVEGYLRFAALLALKFRNRGVAAIDLIQEANVALMNAADRWECNPNYRFLTYSSACIKNELKKSCAKLNALYIPLDMVSAVIKIRKTCKMMRAHRLSPTSENIAQELNIPIDLAEKIMEAYQLSDSMFSLNAPLSDDKRNTLADLVPDSFDKAPETIVTASILHEKVDSVLHTLEPEEEKVIRLRFGFEDGAVHSLTDVAAACAATLEETQLTEIKALRKLRHPSRSAQFAGFLE